MRKLSSLCSRFLPTSLAAQKLSSTPESLPPNPPARQGAGQDSRHGLPRLLTRSATLLQMTGFAHGRGVTPKPGSDDRGSSNGRTPDSGSGYQGSNPCPRTEGAAGVLATSWWPQSPWPYRVTAGDVWPLESTGTQSLPVTG